MTAVNEENMYCRNKEHRDPGRLNIADMFTAVWLRMLIFHLRSMTYWFNNPPVHVRPACSFFPAMFFHTLYSSDIMWLVLALSQHASVSDYSMACGTGYSSRRPVNGEARGANDWSQRSFLPRREPDADRRRVPALETRSRPAGVSRPGDRSLLRPGLRLRDGVWFPESDGRTAVAMEMLEMQHKCEIVLVANRKFVGSQCILMRNI